MTPLERAARALCEARGANGWPILNADPDFGDYPLTDEGTDELNPFTEAEVLTLARAVIESIREPSEGMVKAGLPSMPWGAGDPEGSKNELRTAWRAMIDDLLAEGK